MPLPTYDKKELIPKGFEDEYEEIEGKFVPVDRVGKVMRALEEEREARKAADVSARKAATDLANLQAKAAAAAAGMTEAEHKKLHDTIHDSIRKEYEPQLAEAEKLRKENRDLKLTNVVKQMFAKVGAQESHVDDFWKLHGDEFDLTADGKVMVKVEPGKDVMKHVGTLARQRAEWIKGTRATGGSAQGATKTEITQAAEGGGGITFEDLKRDPSVAVSAANTEGR